MAIQKFESFINKQEKNFDIIIKDNKFILIFKGTKNTYELAEANIDSDLNNRDSWNVSNYHPNGGYAWLYNDMRPYLKYIKMGFLKGTKSGEFSVDFVSIDDDHFNSKKNFLSKHVDHIIVMKRSYYDYDEILERHTIFKIENKNVYKISMEDFKKSYNKK